MKNLLNIEKSNFRRGEYVGYAMGCWHIRKSKVSYCDRWIATKQTGGNEFLFSDTLEEMSEELDQYVSRFVLSR